MMRTTFCINILAIYFGSDTCLSLKESTRPSTQQVGQNIHYITTVYDDPEQLYCLRKQKPPSFPHLTHKLFQSRNEYPRILMLFKICMERAILHNSLLQWAIWLIFTFTKGMTKAIVKDFNMVVVACWEGELPIWHFGYLEERYRL